MMPAKFMKYSTPLPALHDVTQWQLLRKWSLSEVYRATLRTGETRIVKWGGSEMAREAAVYRDLLAPLQIRTPIIYACAQDDEGGVLVMQDAGELNMEQCPHAAYFVEAAGELARIRTVAADSLARGVVPQHIRLAYTATSGHFLDQLEDLRRSERLNNDPVLLQAIEWLPGALQQLDRDVPLTLVHQDFHAKNLVVQTENEIMPVDWSNAYLSNHLGDLYCLIHEARSWAGVPQEQIIQAYEAALVEQRLPIEHLKRQLKTGGLCWLIRSLRWLVYGGTDTIPGSEAWVPDLLSDMGELLEQ